ncbi:MAG: hypothetical protein WAU01_04735 [Saprospiraceae bacterium]
MNLKYVTLYVLLFIGFTGCKVFKKGDKSNSKIEDFDQFYDRFHKDAEFQMSRIFFPIDGEFVDETGGKKWTKQNWQVMKVKIYDVNVKGYKKSFEKTNDSFYQKVWIPNSGFISEYRFKLINQKWMLVYALESNL